MPTTTNFGWTTPADTDLVKDGAAAIRTLGNGVDTSLVDLKGGTSGQVLAKNSNTDMDFVWVAQDDSNAIQNALLTTTGDTIYASAASTPARLGIGSTGQVLTVAGGVPSWATPASGSTFAGVSLYNTPNNQSLSNNTFTVVTWDSEDYDTDGYHSTVTNTSRITIPSGKAGKYLFTGSVYFDPGSTTGMREVALYKNGSNTGKFFIVTAAGSGTFYPNPQMNFVVNAVANDFFQLYVRQNSGGNLTQYFDSGTWFQASYLGA